MPGTILHQTTRPLDFGGSIGITNNQYESFHPEPGRAWPATDGSLGMRCSSYANEFRSRTYFRRRSGVLIRSGSVWIFQRFMRMGCPVFIKLFVAEPKVCFRRMVFGGGEFAMQLMGADVRCVLVTHAARIKRIVVNGDHVFARFCFRVHEP